MNHTALSAAHMVIYPQGLGGGDMVKMRLQGTKEDMEWLEHQLSQLPNVQITEVQVENGVVTNGGNLFLLAKNEKILILANRISIIGTYC